MPIRQVRWRPSSHNSMTESLVERGSCGATTHGLSAAGSSISMLLIKQGIAIMDGSRFATKEIRTVLISIQEG